MLAIQGIAEAGSGHPGASFSAAEIMGVLYFHKMKHKPSDPLWEGRDYFVNSKAHSAPGFYAVLAYCRIYRYKGDKNTQKAWFTTSRTSSQVFRTPEKSQFPRDRIFRWI